MVWDMTSMSSTLSFILSRSWIFFCWRQSLNFWLRTRLSIEIKFSDWFYRYIYGHFFAAIKTNQSNQFFWEFFLLKPTLWAQANQIKPKDTSAARATAITTKKNGNVFFHVKFHCILLFSILKGLQMCDCVWRTAYIFMACIVFKWMEWNCIEFEPEFSPIYSWKCCANVFRLLLCIWFDSEMENSTKCWYKFFANNWNFCRHTWIIRRKQLTFDILENTTKI